MRDSSLPSSFLASRGFDRVRHRCQSRGRNDGVEYWRLRPARSTRLQTVSYLFCGFFFGLAAPVHADDPLPTGFKAERYQRLWERNPFTLVTPATPIQPQAFNKLVVVSWLNDGGKDSLFVQDTDTNEVQKVTDAPNEKGIRLIEVHAKGGKDFQMIRDFEAVITNGSEQGTVKFRSQASAPIVASNPINPLQIPPEVGQNNQIPQQLNGQMPEARVQPTAPYANQGVPPRPQQTRRKRVLPSAVPNANQGRVPEQNQGINQGPGTNQNQ